MKNLLLISAILLLLLQSCVSFPKEFRNPQPMTQSNLTILNGTYSVKAIKYPSQNTEYEWFHNAFNKFYRGFGRGSRDTMNIDNLEGYTFTIQVIDTSEIKIIYSKYDSIFRDFKIKCELKKDGYLYLKNKNLKISGIPYLFGSIDDRRLRLTTANGSLIIEEVHHNSSGVLLIIGDSKTWEYRHEYRKL